MDGAGALPLWLPRPEYDGMITHRFDLSAPRGLTVRPFADTARDTLAWMREQPGRRRAPACRASARPRCSTARWSRKAR